MNYKQCKLIRYRDGAVVRDKILPGENSGIVGVYTCWLPEEFAKAGKIVDLKRGDGSWTTGWTVDEVYNTVSEEYVRTHERDYLDQRKASDI